MNVSRILLVYMAVLTFIFAILVLFIAIYGFWHLPYAASRTDYIQKREAHVLLVKSTSQLVNRDF